MRSQKAGYRHMSSNNLMILSRLGAMPTRQKSFGQKSAGHSVELVISKRHYVNSSPDNSSVPRQLIPDNSSPIALIWRLVPYCSELTTRPLDNSSLDNSSPGQFIPTLFDGEGLGIENIAPDNLVRLGWVRLGLLMTQGWSCLSIDIGDELSGGQLSRTGCRGRVVSGRFDVVSSEQPFSTHKKMGLTIS